MKKYIVSAKNHDDAINLMRNTRGVDLTKVKWDWANVSRSYDDARCDGESEVVDAIVKGDFHKVDDMIMGGDVPVGGMVVVCGKTRPVYGFICGNGIDWFLLKLKVRESNAIASAIVGNGDANDEED
jgi:hypothetical protein